MKRSVTALRSATIPFWFPIALFLVWQVVSSMRLLDPLFFPPPARLLEVARTLAASGELAMHIKATLMRCAVGFGVGGTLGLLLGVLMGAVPAVRRAFEPAISALYTTPRMSLLPMLMLLVGVGDAARMSLVALGVFIIVVINTVDGLRNIDPHYVEMAETYGASRWDTVRHVYLPASFPHVFTGLRLGLGRALMSTISIELISSPDGIGSLVWIAWQTFSPEKLYVGVLVCAALGAIFHSTLKAAERRLSPWRAQ